MPVRNRIAEMLPELTEWRRDFHEHPELLFEVHRTAGIVAQKLRDFGCDEVVEGIGRTGVVGVINGNTNASGRTIGLRADMDALPIKEATGLEYASKTDGVMHACGHDGHTTMLLGAAKYLAETRNFDGKVVVIFQPAEEGGGGGKEMVEDGMMDRWGVDEVYGMHNMPGFPVGSFHIRPGALMAAADEFAIVIEGKGAHAAKPHEGIDTTVVASHIVLAVQTIAARFVDPLEQVVVSICGFQTDTNTYNVIPQRVTLKGTVRTMSDKVQDQVEKLLPQIVEGTAATFGAKADVQYHRGYPVTVNAEENTGYAVAAAEKVAGACDPNTVPLMGAEDFSFMLNARPGAYIFMGNGDTASVHHPEYNFDDTAMPAGVSWFAEMVESRLPAG